MWPIAMARVSASSGSYRDGKPLDPTLPDLVRAGRLNPVSQSVKKAM